MKTLYLNPDGTYTPIEHENDVTIRISDMEPIEVPDVVFEEAVQLHEEVGTEAVFDTETNSFVPPEDIVV